MERHRLQAEVIHRASDEGWWRTGSCLQFAPDPVSDLLAATFDQFSTADVQRGRADRLLDLRELAMPDESLDVIYASHVLEHIDDDERALEEIHRVLAPGGVAVLPVPLIADRTTEYPAPNPREDGHVRAPGRDYFDRYRAVFRFVRVLTSEDVDQDIQPWIYEDRSCFPTPSCPHRPAMAGDRHLDVVPLCFK